PSGLTEEFCVETIQNVANRLARKFTIPGCDVDDIRSQAMLFAVEGLKHFDSSRPLPGFLLYIAGIVFQLCVGTFGAGRIRRADSAVMGCRVDLTGKCANDMRSGRRDRSRRGILGRRLGLTN